MAVESSYVISNQPSSSVLTVEDSEHVRNELVKDILISIVKNGKPHRDAEHRFADND